MNDARYTKGDAASQAKASVPSRQLIVGLLRSVGKDWKTVLIITAGIVLIGEALLPEDHKLRPANLYAAFSGDTQAGIHDRMRRVDAKYNVLEHDLISKIDRETTAVTKAIEARIYDREKRIDAVDRHQMPTLKASTPSACVRAARCLRIWSLSGSKLSKTAMTGSPI